MTCVSRRGDDMCGNWGGGFRSKELSGAVLAMELKASLKLGKISPTELHPQPLC